VKSLYWSETVVRYNRLPDAENKIAFDKFHINAIVLKVSNGSAEGLNSRIKMLKVRSRGFRNKERFSNAFYFHFGGLDPYPESAAI